MKFNILGNNFSALKNFDPIFEIISKVAEDLDQPTFVIGGFVRDVMLERKSKDIDLVTLGSGIELAKTISRKINSTNVKIFKNFGTAMILFNDLEIQFVGARKESYRAESRKPIVENGTLEDDQNRRDFTINSLAVGLSHEFKGEFIDPFNGLKHLKEKIIKTPLDPDITFSDDPLRMMRAIRFAAQLNFDIEERTLQSIKNNAHRIEIVAQERITEELNKIILSENPSVGFRLMEETKLLKIIFPEFNLLKGVEIINGMGHKDNFYHTLEVLENLLPHSKDNLWLRWAALLHDIAKPKTKRFSNSTGWTFHGHEDKGSKMVPKIFKRLKLPQDEKMRYVQKLVFLHLRPISLTNEKISDAALRRLLFEAGEDLEDLMFLCQSDITSKNLYKKQKFLNRFEEVKKKLKDVENRDKIKNWQPPVDGKEIMNYFKIKPCKEVGLIKEAIKNAILDGDIKNNKQDAFSYMVEKGKELGISNEK
mgnify:FL=1